MNVQPIKMQKFEARETLQQYRALIKERRTRWDLAIMKSAKAILKGKQVIRLVDAIAGGGFDANNFPNLAVCRADAAWVRCHRIWGQVWMHGIDRPGEYVSEWGNKGWRHIARDHPRVFQFNVDANVQHSNAGGSWRESEAMVPSIPPAHRPLKEKLGNYVMLWEAEWKRVAPVDPMLLAPLGEGMYAVVAVWNLSPLEQAVLATERDA